MKAHDLPLLISFSSGMLIKYFLKTILKIVTIVYTMLFSNENGKKSCCSGLPFKLKRFHNRHQMKTILKTARFENGTKRFSANA